VPGVRVRELETIEEMRAVAGLLAEVWGTNEEGVPINSEVMRGLVHAGGLVNAAYDGDGLVGGAVLGRAEPGACYSFIAAARPGLSDRGIGFALKQHQRTWALAHGVHTMSWTFDPLVARNARFNLTKLGATVDDYEAGYYGIMTDELNGHDRADRLVPRWRLDSERAAAAAAGTLPEPPAPPPDVRILGQGPDGGPAYVAAGAERWIRMPTDIVALRRSDPAQASAWRGRLAEWLPALFADGWVADGVTRDGRYHLRPATS
jgi:predicted GNAT superfamily acetyltransferase